MATNPNQPDQGDQNGNEQESPVPVRKPSPNQPGEGGSQDDQQQPGQNG